MIIVITGPTHVGKTYLAHQFMLQRACPYVSMDHLKMGLIRSGQTSLTPVVPEEVMTAYLWPIVAEWIKTAIENDQSVIVEGCYVPGTWAEAFEPAYLAQIRVVALVMTDAYLTAHYDTIVAHRSVIETRDPGDVPSLEGLRAEHAIWRARSRRYGIPAYVIDDRYTVTPDAIERLWTRDA